MSAPGPGRELRHDALRASAEQRLRQVRAKYEQARRADLESLVHELQVHQVELEIQNEQLRDTQAELAVATARYRDLYELAPVGYLTLHADRTVQQANLKAAELLGELRGQVVGRDLALCFHAEHRDGVYLHLRRTATARLAESCELRADAAAAERWLRLETAPIVDGADAFAGWRMTLHDVTDRRTAEQTLRTLNETLEERVAERTRRLKLTHDITSAANATNAIEPTLAFALRRVGEGNGWCVGFGYLNDHADPLRLLPLRRPYLQRGKRFDRLCERVATTPLRPGEDLPGGAVQTGQVQWTTDLGEAFRCRGPDIVLATHLRCAVALPVMVGDQAVGALEFFSEKRFEITPDLLDALGSVGVQLGRVVERQRFDRALARALLDEQQRVGQDLHDTVGQELAGLGLIAARAQRQAADGAVTDPTLLAELSYGLRHALDEMRTVVRGLLLPVAAGGRLAPALEEMVAAVTRRWHVDTVVVCPTDLAVGPGDVAAHLYRIAAEAVTNAAKHAGARCVTLRVELTPGALVLSVTDDGHGFRVAADTEGAGQRIMRHRAEVIGAALEVDSTPGQGTLVRCTMPRVRLQVVRAEVDGDQDADPHR